MAVKMKDIRDKNTPALEKQERDLHDQLFKLRFQSATNQNENPGRIRLARKELARVKTVLNERRVAERAAASSPAAASPAKPGGKE